MKRPDQIAKSSGTIVNIKLYCSVNSRHASGGGGDSQWARPQSFKASPEAVYLGTINTLTEDYSRLRCIWVNEPDVMLSESYLF